MTINASDLLFYPLIFYGAISFVSFVLTIYDKTAAQAGKRRIPEKVLLCVGIIGGACAEWLTMLLIRHKTRKKKFMITLPIFALVHLALIITAFHLVAMSMIQTEPNFVIAMVS